MNLGRESVVQIQNSLRYLGTEFLSVASEAGELEKTTNILVSEARDLIRFCRVDPDLINRYMELHHDEYNKQMRQRKLKRVSSRTSSTSKYSESVNLSNTDGEAALDFKEDHEQEATLDMDDLDANRSVTGERIDMSHLDLTKDDDNRNNDLDRNMELVSLLKKKSIYKKRKDRDDSDSDADKKKMTKTQTTVNKAEKKKKKKSKKKKKIDGKCVIDDIFDGF
jgi:hypothetical protein